MNSRKEQIDYLFSTKLDLIIQAEKIAQMARFDNSISEEYINILKERVDIMYDLVECINREMLLIKEEKDIKDYEVITMRES